MIAETQVFESIVCGVIYMLALFVFVLFSHKTYKVRLKREKENFVAQLAHNGQLYRTPNIGINIQHINNPDTVEAFIRKFSEARDETVIDLKRTHLWLKVSHVNMNEDLVKDLEKAGLNVTIADDFD